MPPLNRGPRRFPQGHGCGRSQTSTSSPRGCQSPGEGGSYHRWASVSPPLKNRDNNAANFLRGWRVTTTVGDTKIRGHKIREGSRPRSWSTDMPSGLARARRALGGPMAPCPWAPRAWLRSPSGDAQGSQGAGEGAAARAWGEPWDTLQGRVTLWGEEGSLVGRGRSRESPARRAARCPPTPSGASSPLGPWVSWEWFAVPLSAPRLPVLTADVGGQCGVLVLQSLG